MPYQRIVSTLGCAELNLSEALALSARHGLDGIEVRALGGTLDLPAYLQLEYGTPDGLASRLGDQRTRIFAFSTSIRLTDGSVTERDRLLAFVPWAERLGLRWLRVFDGNCLSDGVIAAEAIDTIEWWRTIRRQHGWRVDLMVETHDSLLNTAAITQFATAIPGTKILWDTHHTWKRGENPLDTWRAIRPHVVHVHVKDSVSQPSRQHPYTYTKPGGGEFPMGPLVDALRREFQGCVCLEWERMWHPYLPPLESALVAATAAGWW